MSSFEKLIIPPHEKIVLPISFVGQNQFEARLAIVIKSAHGSQTEYHPTHADLNRMTKMKNAGVIENFLLGRFAAISALKNHSRKGPSTEFIIETEKNGRPKVTSSDHELNLNISISHKSDIAAAIAFENGLQIGIDVESQEKKSILEKFWQDREVPIEPMGDFDSHKIAWTVWESIYKIVGSDLPLKDNFKLQNIELLGDRLGLDAHYGQDHFFAGVFCLPKHYLAVVSRNPIKNFTKIDLGDFRSA